MATHSGVTQSEVQLGVGGGLRVGGGGGGCANRKQVDKSTDVAKAMTNFPMHGVFVWCRIPVVKDRISWMVG